MSPDIAASVRARLLTKAKAQREEFERTLSRFATERLLFRLGASDARTRCILKGAGLLTVWLKDPYRATRDVDFLASGARGNNDIREILEEICTEPCPEDGLRFDLADLQMDVIRADDEHVGTRARFVAFLGTARIRIQIDFGVGDAVTPGPETVEYPTILADLPAPCIQAYPCVVSVAEKFEAMVKLDIRNSRMKDFHDIWALSGEFEFDGITFQQAIAACFARRSIAWTIELPSALTSAFYRDSALQARWAGYLRRGGVLIVPPTQFELIGERVAEFLGPVRESIVLNTPFQARWSPGGPWA